MATTWFNKQRREKILTVSTWVLAVSTGLSTRAEATILGMSAKSDAPTGYLEADDREARLVHARELLGKYYKKSVVRLGEKVDAIHQFIMEQTKDSISGPQNSRAEEVAATILKESNRYRFDPMFLLAVIQNESSFRTNARGTSGEIGLMQILPSTAEWIAKKYRIQWRGVKSLEDPVVNVQLGAAYLNHLRERFSSHGQLYLSAYNMGTGNVRGALEKQIWPREYAARVMQWYIAFYSKLGTELGANTDRKTASVIR